ncbi:MAG: hypothetical protein ACLRSE_02580 [Alistipes finegoldii]
MIPGAEGEVEPTGEKMLSAVVISDAGNYNMETNPNLTDTSIDFSVNEKTAYIESLDGQYGLRIVTKLPADNILKRYSSVQLSINGLKLRSRSRTPNAIRSRASPKNMSSTRTPERPPTSRRRRSTFRSLPTPTSTPM